VTPFLSWDRSNGSTQHAAKLFDNVMSIPLFATEKDPASVFPLYMLFRLTALLNQVFSPYLIFETRHQPGFSTLSP
jgi:hypothetical protein